MKKTFARVAAVATSAGVLAVVNPAVLIGANGGWFI